MGVHDVLFPPNLSRGTRGGPGFKSLIVESDAGLDVRSTEWETNRSALTFEVAKTVQNAEDAAELLNFVLGMRGAADGFLFWDESDWSTNPNHRTLPNLFDPVHRSRCERIGDAPNGGGHYQLQKTYYDPSGAGRHALRRITRPIKPEYTSRHAMMLFWNGVPLYVHVSGLPLTFIQPLVEVYVSYDGGIATVAPDPGHLDWAGTFHVPARFGRRVDDLFDASWDEANQFSIDGIDIVELVGDNGEGPQTHLYGGGEYVPLVGNPHVVDLSNGAYQKFAGDPRPVQMPSEGTAELPAGGPIVTLENGTAGTILVRTQYGSFIGALTPGQYGVLVRNNDGGIRDWEMV